MSFFTETNLTVRYCETDRMGIVHHSRYFPWFEVGRTDFIKQSGLTYSQMEEAGVLLPLIESGANYLKGAKYEDELVVKTCLDSLRPTVCEFHYEILRPADGTLIATGKTIHAFVNEEFKPMNLKKKNPAIWKLLINIQGK